MRRLLAITALTVAGFATAVDAEQINPAVFVADSAPVATGLSANAGEAGADLHQANFKFKKKRFHKRGFRSRSFIYYGHPRFKKFGHVRSRGFRGHGFRSRGFHGHGFRSRGFSKH
mgnify:FL=1